MAKGVPIQGKDPLGKAKYANVTESGDLRVQLSGTYPQHRLLSTDPKPDAATEGKGAVIYEIDTGKVYMSTGAVWQEVS